MGFSGLLNDHKFTGSGLQKSLPSQLHIGFPEISVMIVQRIHWFKFCGGQFLYLVAAEILTIIQSITWITCLELLEQIVSLFQVLFQLSAVFLSSTFRKCYLQPLSFQIIFSIIGRQCTQEEVRSGNPNLKRRIHFLFDN